MPIQKIQIPVGGTGESQAGNLLDDLGIENHTLLDINSNGEVVNLDADNLSSISSLTTQDLNVTNIIGGNFAKIRNAYFIKDSTNYSTSSTTAYAANGSLLGSISPVNSNTNLLVIASAYMSNGSTNGAFRGRLYYYDGSTYDGNGVGLYFTILFAGTVDKRERLLGLAQSLHKLI